MLQILCSYTVTVPLLVTAVFIHMCRCGKKNYKGHQIEHVHYLLPLSNQKTLFVPCDCVFAQGTSCQTMDVL